MLTRTQLLTLLKISSDDLKNRNRRLLVPFETENRPRNEYSPGRGARVFADRRSDFRDDDAERRAGHDASRGWPASFARGCSVCGACLPHGDWEGASRDRGNRRGARALRRSCADEIFVEVVWLVGGGRLALAGTLEQISEKRLRIRPVRGVLMNATRACAELLNRARAPG